MLCGAYVPPPGEHEVRVVFRPEGAPGGGRALSLEERVRFDPTRVVLVTLENDRLILK